MQTDPIKFSDRFFHLPISQDFRVQDSDGIDLKLLEGLSQVNIFVGPNNHTLAAYMDDTTLDTRLKLYLPEKLEEK